MANAADAGEVLARAAAREDVPALTRALAAVLDANDRITDPNATGRFGLSRDFSAGFDAGVEYAADLAVVALREHASRVEAEALENHRKRS